MDDPKEALTALSDRMLRELDHLRATEQKKRREDISTPPFHELADEVAASSRRIFRIGAEEERLGDLSETGDVSIEDLERQG